jgi:hypothetical protein
MIATNLYRIRFAAAEDADTLKRLAETDSQGRLAGRVLIGHIDGTPAAAISLLDGRVTADPSRRTGHLAATLRMRADAIHAYEATPSLRDRLHAAFSDARGDSVVVPVPVAPSEQGEQKPMREAA